MSEFKKGDRFQGLDEVIEINRVHLVQNDVWISTDGRHWPVSSLRLMERVGCTKTMADWAREAPEWAAWVAQDPDGSVWAYEKHPMMHSRWTPYQGRRQHLCETQLLMDTRRCPNWRETLTATKQEADTTFALPPGRHEAACPSGAHAALTELELEIVQLRATVDEHVETIGELQKRNDNQYEQLKAWIGKDAALGYQRQQTALAEKLLGLEQEKVANADKQIETLSHELSDEKWRSNNKTQTITQFMDQYQKLREALGTAIGTDVFGDALRAIAKLSEREHVIKCQRARLDSVDRDKASLQDQLRQRTQERDAANARLAKPGILFTKQVHAHLGGTGGTVGAGWPVNAGAPGGSPSTPAGNEPDELAGLPVPNMVTTFGKAAIDKMVNDILGPGHIVIFDEAIKTIRDGDTVNIKFTVN